MNSEFRRVRLGDVCEKIGSGATPKGGREAYSDTGPCRLIRSQNIYNERFSPAGLVFINESQANKLDGVTVLEGDVLLNITGDSVARVCLVPSEYLPARVNQHVAIIRPRPDTIDNRFLRYFLASPGQQGYMLGLAAAGATRNALTKSMIENFEVICPPLHEQRRIGDFLALIDSRIALLHETNTTLEAIAQALFKSWFVDFDPVHAKSAGRPPEGLDEATAALFPDEFEKSALCPTPKGWRLVPFGELLVHTIGGDWGDEVRSDANDIRVAIVRGTDIPELSRGNAGRVPIRYTSRQKLSSRQLAEGDIVVEVSGGSKDQPTGRSLYATAELLSQFDCPVEPASFCRLLRPCADNVGVLLAQHMQYIYSQGKTWEYQNQSTGISNFQTTHFLKTELVVLPPSEVREAFAHVVKPLVERAQMRHIRMLEGLRATLLPRLISGQLRLPEAEALLQDAA